MIVINGRTFAFKAMNNGVCNVNDIIFHYQVGRSYKNNAAPVVCKHGYHACYNIDDVFSYYNFLNPNIEVYLVEILGEIDIDGDKIATNHIKIIKKLIPDEFNKLSSKYMMNIDGTIYLRLHKNPKIYVRNILENVPTKSKSSKRRSCGR